MILHALVFALYPALEDVSECVLVVVDQTVQDLHGAQLAVEADVPAHVAADALAVVVADVLQHVLVLV